MKESRNFIGLRTNKNGGTLTQAFCFRLKTQHIGCGPFGDDSFQQSLLNHGAVILTDCLLCLMHNWVFPRKKDAWEIHFLKPWMSKHVFIFYLQLAWIRFSTLRVIFPLGFKGIASLLSCSRVALRSPKPFVMGFWHFTMMCLVMCQFLFLMVDFLNLLHSKIFLTLLLMILTLLVLLLPFSGTPFILILDLLGWFISLLFCLLFVFAICWGVGNFLNCIF